MERRNFLKALLGTAAIAPLAALVVREEAAIPVATSGYIEVAGYNNQMHGLQYIVNNTGTWQGISRETWEPRRLGYRMVHDPNYTFDENGPSGLPAYEGD